jgi:hypothetical protein
MKQSTPTITRGEDAAFTIRLLDSSGRPYDLTNWVYLRLRLPADPTGAVLVDSSTTPAVPAVALAQGVNFTAVTPGTVGNSIELVFDGTETLATVATAWNTANASNQVSYSGLGTVVLTAATVQLDQGQNALQKLLPASPLQLGKIRVMLRDTDTTQLKLSKNQTIELTIDKLDAFPAGNRKIVLMADALSVRERFF